MSKPTRGQVRAALGVLLTAGVPSAQAVYTAQVGSFAGQSPVLVLTSAGSARSRQTQAGSGAEYRYNLHTFVLYSDAASGWTEADAEDALDAIEAEVAALAEANARGGTIFNGLAYADPTDARAPAVIDGVEYRHEVIPLVAYVY
jgi:hypothetical protein